MHVRGDRLLSVFPAVLDSGLSGVFVSASSDGVSWRPPALLAPSAALPEWRTSLYPVDGLVVRGGELELYLEHVRLEHGEQLQQCHPPTRRGSLRYGRSAAAYAAANPGCFSQATADLIVG